MTSPTSALKNKAMHAGKVHRYFSHVQSQDPADADKMVRTPFGMQNNFNRCRKISQMEIGLRPRAILSVLSKYVSENYCPM